MKKILIFVSLSRKKFFDNKKRNKKFRKNYTNIILYDFKYKYNSKTFVHNKKI